MCELNAKNKNLLLNNKDSGNVKHPVCSEKRNIIAGTVN